MAKTFFFYDLETSGFNPRVARITQFAGQRTNLKLRPIGQPVNHLIKLTDDVLPDPEAVLLTGITPQMTLAHGMSEAEFLKLFHSQIATPDTLFVGFNSIRFDDEFVRYLNYRNFYDPYEWGWKNGRLRWDLLDVVRMMRALRPDGIKWPSDSDGTPVNRLELLASANKLTHEKAHDALSDVTALIELARLIQSKQPKLFNYLLDIMTSKAKVSELVMGGEPFVYCSGKYESEYQKTTVVATLAAHPKRQAALVFDLRSDPLELADLSEAELMDLWVPEGKSNRFFPIKTLMFNRGPAIAPLSVVDAPSAERLALDLGQVNKNFKNLTRVKTEFSKKILNLVDQLDRWQDDKYRDRFSEVDSQLYDGFFNDRDKKLTAKVVMAQPAELRSMAINFEDKRLNSLLPLYKARNFPEELNEADKLEWQKFRKRLLISGKDDSRMAKYFNELSALSSGPNLTKQQKNIIADLKEYGEDLIKELV